MSENYCQKCGLPCYPYAPCPSCGNVPGSPKRARKLQGGPGTCWHCQRYLIPGFAVVVDPIGNRMRVHRGCVRHVIGDGYREVTA